MVIVVDEIMWTGNLGTSILRVQQAGANAVKDEKALEGGHEALPQEGDVAAEGPSESAVQTFLDYSLEQIEAMIDLVRGDLDRWGISGNNVRGGRVVAMTGAATFGRKLCVRRDPSQLRSNCTQPLYHCTVCVF